MSMMDQDILKVLYTQEEIAARVKELGEQMYEDFKGKDPLFVSVLRGAFIFMADIVRAMILSIREISLTACWRFSPE